jgi:putative ABC transport system substrate-binding protein
MNIHQWQRREVVTLLGTAAASSVSWPLTARAQQPAIPTIGYLVTTSAEQWASALHAFRQGLSETGFVEGRNLAIEYRWADSRADRFPAMAADLVRGQVAVIATGGNAAVLAAKTATSTIPIVFSTSSDPVQLGLVTSLNRPGGNVTGVTLMGAELAPKRLEMLHELVPTAKVVGLLVNPTNPTIAGPITKDVEAAAGALGLQLHVLHASSERELEAVFASLVKLRAGGLVIGVDALFNGRSAQLAALALANKVPAIFHGAEFAAAGGLMSYGGDFSGPFRLVGVYTGRILKGERPADLPVQQSTKIELILNLKTAKTLGVSVPTGLLVRANDVIE